MKSYTPHSAVLSHGILAEPAAAHSSAFLQLSQFKFTFELPLSYMTSMLQSPQAYCKHKRNAPENTSVYMAYL